MLSDFTLPVGRSFWSHLTFFLKGQNELPYVAMQFGKNKIFFLSVRKSGKYSEKGWNVGTQIID